MADRDGRRRHAPHGTRARYNHRTDPCRCPACTEANTIYEADRRAQRKAEAAGGERPIVDEAGNVLGWELPLFD